MDWDSFTVRRTAVHYVPTSKDERHPRLLLTNAEIDLDEDLTAYFGEKVASRLLSRGLEVVEDESIPQDAVDAVEGILEDEDDFVELSQELAQRLFEIQSGQNSSGLLTVILGEIDDESCVAIVKLERQRGVSFDIDPANGTVDLELLRNLTLTDKTKVYKTALFVAGDTTRLLGYVSDDQRTSGRGHQVAGFFLGRFLGCKAKEPAQQLTYDFVRAANKGINDVVDSAERRGRYQVALLSTLQDNDATINPRAFVDRYFDETDRQPFLENLEAAGIGINGSFPKDTSRVRIDEFKITFESGMVLVGPPEALDERVGIPDEPGTDHPVELHDQIDTIITGR